MFKAFVEPQSLVQAGMALRSGATTSRRLVEDALARIADPSGEGARTFIEHYPEQARRQAGAADAQLAQGEDSALPLPRAADLGEEPV